jgi:hypothetical protein
MAELEVDMKEVFVVYRYNGCRHGYSPPLAVYSTYIEAEKTINRVGQLQQYSMNSAQNSVASRYLTERREEYFIKCLILDKVELDLDTVATKW